MAIIVAHVPSGFEALPRNELERLAASMIGKVVWFPDDPQGSRVGVVEHARSGSGGDIVLTIKVDDDAVIFLDRAPSDWRFIDKDWR